MCVHICVGLCTYCVGGYACMCVCVDPDITVSCLLQLLPVVSHWNWILMRLDGPTRESQRSLGKHSEEWEVSPNSNRTVLILYPNPHNNSLTSQEQPWGPRHLKSFLKKHSAFPINSLNAEGPEHTFLCKDSVTHPITLFYGLTKVLPTPGSSEALVCLWTSKFLCSYRPAGSDSSEQALKSSTFNKLLDRVSLGLRAESFRVTAHQPTQS